MHFLFKHILLFLLFILAMPGSYAQKQMALDPALRQDSERWIAKMAKITPRGFFQFGQYKVIQAEKIDSLRVSKEKGKFFELRPLFGESKSSNSKKFYRLIAGYNKDTALINLTVSLVSTTHTPGFFSKKDESTSIDIDDVIAIMQIGTDTVPWQFHSGTFQINSDIEIFLTHGEDEYSIEGINHFEGKEKSLLGPFPKGIEIKDKTGKAVAALQLNQKNYIWLRKGLPDNLSLALAASVSLILSGKSRTFLKL